MWEGPNLEKTMVDEIDKTETIGNRIRTLRRKQGKSLAVVAGLAGISKSLLSQVERGLKPMNNRHHVAAVAEALGVSVTVITGQSDRSTNDRDLNEVTLGLTRIRDTLVRRSLDFAEGTPTRSIDELGAEVERIGKLRRAARYGDVVRLLPDILDELYELYARGESRDDVAELLVMGALRSTVARTFGHHALASIVADRTRAIAEEMNNPLWVAFSDYGRAQNLSALGAFRRAHAVSMRAANELESRGMSGPEMEVYGMLHLHAALALTSTGNPYDGIGHLDEANRIAQRTGEAQSFGLWFGPTNVGIWRMALTVESGNGERVAEIANVVNPRIIPAPDRRCDYYVELGRGLAQTQKDDRRAFLALRQAEEIAPQKVRSNPLIRDVVATMGLRSQRGSHRQELYSMAHRMGLAI
jgi:transcriptional regulator with XRE-family HTH domain